MKYFKLNQTVYHPIYGEGEVISTNYDFLNCPILVQFKNTNVSFAEDGEDYQSKLIVLSQNPIPEIVNKPLEDDYIPFTFEDKELLRGKWIQRKGDKFELQITGFSENGVLASSFGYMSFELLLKEYEFLDGKVCGKLV